MDNWPGAAILWTTRRSRPFSVGASNYAGFRGPEAAGVQRAAGHKTARPQATGLAEPETPRARQPGDQQPWPTGDDRGWPDRGQPASPDQKPPGSPDRKPRRARQLAPARPRQTKVTRTARPQTAETCRTGDPPTARQTTRHRGSPNRRPTRAPRIADTERPPGRSPPGPVWPENPRLVWPEITRLVGPDHQASPDQKPPSADGSKLLEARQTGSREASPSRGRQTTDCRDSSNRSPPTARRTPARPIGDHCSAARPLGDHRSAAARRSGARPGISCRWVGRRSEGRRCRRGVGASCPSPSPTRPWWSSLPWWR